MAPTACKRTVSGTISPPYSGYFSPFPHGTCSLSVSQEYLALPDGAGRFRQSFTCSALLRILLSLKSLTCTGLSPSMVDFPKSFQFILMLQYAVLQPHYAVNKWFGLFRVRSPLLTESLLFSLPPGT